MKRIKKLKKKLNNHGSSIIMVVVSLAFIGIIVGALLSAAGYAYRLKLQNLNAKDNFYYVEQAMQEVYAGIGAKSVEEMKDAYVYTVENMVRYDLQTGTYVTISDAEANIMFRDKFIQNISNSDEFSQGADHLAEVLEGYITNETVDLDNGKISIEETVNSAGEKQIIIKNVTLTRVQEYSKSAGSGTYTQTISTDIVISEPDFEVKFNSMSSDYSEIFNYALVGDMGIEIVAANLTPSGTDATVNTTTAALTVTPQLNINGNLYAGADYYNKSYNNTAQGEIIENDGIEYTMMPVSSKKNDASGYYNLYAKDVNGDNYTFDGVNERSMNSGIYISGRTVSIMTGMMVVPGTIAVMDKANLTIYGSSGETAEIWADNVVLGGSSTADKDGTYTGSQMYISGKLYVRDDTELNAKGSKFTLLGSYYGYGNSTSKDSRVFVPTVDINNFAIITTEKQSDGNLTINSENRGHYNSSSIVVNGESSTLDLSRTNTIYLAGRAYIELSKNVDTSASTEDTYKETYVFQPKYTVDDETNFIRDYKTGESISVKSNQLMYDVSSLGSATTVTIGGVEYDAVKVNSKYTADDDGAAYNAKAFFSKFFPIEIFGGYNVLTVKQIVNGKTTYYIDLETAYDILTTVKADTTATYTATQIAAANLALNGISSEADFMQSFVLAYENDIKNNEYSELRDVINYDEFDQGTLNVGSGSTIYSSGAITTRKDSTFTMITQNDPTVAASLLNGSAYKSNYTYSSSDNTIDSIEAAFDLSRDFELEYNYIKWNLNHYKSGDVEKAYVNYILSEEGEDYISPINKYIVVGNIKDETVKYDTLSGYTVWVSNDDVVITGDKIINGIVICKGNVTFGSDVEEFNGMVISGSKIYIGDKLTKLTASPTICRGVIRDCITAGDSNAKYILSVFAEYKNYVSTDDTTKPNVSTDTDAAMDIEAISYTDVVSMTNWMKNVGGDYDGE